MRSTTVVIVGAGHCGLAMSRCLSERSIDHVVLERGEVANSWRTERWDSLRLLTPNWQSRLPGHAYDGADPDGFSSMPEVVGFIERYARAIAAPVETATTVTSVRRDRVRLSGGDRSGRLAWPSPGHRQRRLQCPLRPEARRGRARIDHDADPAPTIASRTSCRTAACSWSARRPQACSSRTRSSGRAGRSSSPAASTSASPGPTGAGTSNGGWTVPGCWTSATTRSTTSRGRAGCPRSSSWARPSGPRSTSMRCRASASSSSAALPAVPMAGCSFPARCTIIAPWPT